MTTIKETNIKTPVVLMKLLENKKLLVVDSNTTIRYLENQELKVAGGFKANIPHQRYSTSVIAFSSDAAVFATLSPDCKESRLYDAKRKKLKAKMDRHQGEASCVGIDVANKYMFSCGDDGKTFAIDIESGKLAFTLPIHVDTVNDIAFSSNGNWIATASYDKKISLFHLATMTPKAKLRAHASAVIKVAFIGQDRLISIDKNAKAIVWSVYSGKVIERLEGIHDEVTQVKVGGDNKFIFLGTKLGFIIVYDAVTYEQISRGYVKLSSAITALEFDEESNHLIVGSKDGLVQYYDIYEGLEKLKGHLKKKEYAMIQSSTEINPILKYTKIYDMVSNLWEKALEKAKIALFNRDKKTAILLFEQFKSIPERNRVIQKTLKEFSEYDKFVSLAKDGKIVLAYGMANAHPLYKESKIYQFLEMKWQKTFTLAQKYMLDPKGSEKAREVLAPYRGVSEKTKLMQELFTQVEVYKRFKDTVDAKDFKIAFELIRLHPYLKEFPEYSSLMNYADNLYIKSQGLMNNGDMASATKILRVLQNFADFADETKELLEHMEAKTKFYDAVRGDDIVMAYKMLDMDEELLDTDEGKTLQDSWAKDITRANAYAADGEIAKVKQRVQKYMNVDSKYMSLGTVFGWAYMIEIEKAMAKKEDREHIENGIKNYILCFGLQDQIISLFEIFIKKYPDSKLSIELLTKGSLEMWRPAMIVESIFE